jgi:hypothetical protein
VRQRHPAVRLGDPGPSSPPLQARPAAPSPAASQQPSLDALSPGAAVPHPAATPCGGACTSARPAWTPSWRWSCAMWPRSSGATSCWTPTWAPAPSPWRRHTGAQRRWVRRLLPAACCWARPARRPRLAPHARLQALHAALGHPGVQPAPHPTPCCPELPRPAPGADIDFRVIRGVGKTGADGQPASIWSNFQQYGLEHPIGLLRMDIHNPPLRLGLEGVLGAIVGDPPYGVRAGAKKVVHIPGAEVGRRGGGGVAHAARLLQLPQLAPPADGQPPVKRPAKRSSDRIGRHLATRPPGQPAIPPGNPCAGHPPRDPRPPHRALHAGRGAARPAGPGGPAAGDGRPPGVLHARQPRDLQRGRGAAAPRAGAGGQLRAAPDQQVRGRWGCQGGGGRRGCGLFARPTHPHQPTLSPYARHSGTAGGSS